MSTEPPGRARSRRPGLRCQTIIKKCDLPLHQREKYDKFITMAKGDLIKKYQIHKEDTGSTEVQVAVLTKKIADLTGHLKDHKKDYDSRMGLLKMVGKRRRLLNYLRKTQDDKYEALIKDLGLRK